ncbi:hypothetical protein A2U01_0116430, partial [Trifolium medium]|nr:hypothetical protein [Trifolium medium]
EDKPSNALRQTVAVSLTVVNSGFAAAWI